MSYSSFKKIKEKAINPREELKNSKKYYAHTHKTKKSELLIDHLDSVTKAFLQLAEIHSLDQVVDSLLRKLIGSISKIKNDTLAGNCIKRLFIEAIIFHDIGKVNENFQSERMDNTEFRPVKNKIGSQHSILSAYLFLNKIYQEINSSAEFNNEEKYFFFTLAILLANSILKHHAGFIDHNVHFESEIFEALKKYSSILKINNLAETQGFTDPNLVIENFRKAFGHIDYFPLFLLLKLNYALLTASDYMATNAYMYDLRIDNFGLLGENKKATLKLNFRTKKAYNRHFFENKAFYEKLPLRSLQNRSEENLNKLRNKLLSEVITTAQIHSDYKIFYLEAPTGSGKTNLSLSASLEFLDQDSRLNKIFYVFPFTTLATQTASVIKETLGLTDEEIIELHFRSGFHSKREENNDGDFSSTRLNHLDNLFLNYPFVLTSHIKFFDILKGNNKDSNYILHRLNNSIIVFDEIQSYPPRHWDKIFYFLSNYAKYFNIKVILMSATLPKINRLIKESELMVISLIGNKDKYFQNSNFRDRVKFDTSLLKIQREDDKDKYLKRLSDFVYDRSETYASRNSGNVKSIVEFITKQSATNFYSKVINKEKEGFFEGYKVFLISGTILEPRRREIIEKIKSVSRGKVLVISTQVIEAGVDLDMDIGFKDKSLIDSEEQLAGRVNRNASKNTGVVYIFNLDKEWWIYKNDYRYQVTRDNIPLAEYKRILTNKDFNALYTKVFEKIWKKNEDEFQKNITDYIMNFKHFDFSKINNEFRLIESEENSLFIPLKIPVEIRFSQHKTLKLFLESEKRFLTSINNEVLHDGKIDGRIVFNIFEQIVTKPSEDFVKRNVDIKNIYGIMSKFMLSVLPRQMKELQEVYCDHEKYRKFGIWYLSDWAKNDLYSYEGGLDTKKLESGGIFW